jgi:predicted nuclease of predicted toxin-antitoxin system
MKFLLDQGLPRSAVKRLADLGIAAEQVGDLGMAAATDAAILEAAKNRGSVVATLDADFHALLAASGATTHSVVRIRIEGLKGDRLAKILASVVARAGSELTAGAVVSVTKSRIRVRLLPITR